MSIHQWRYCVGREGQYKRPGGLLLHLCLSAAESPRQLSTPAEDVMSFPYAGSRTGGGQVLLCAFCSLGLEPAFGCCHKQLDLRIMRPR